MSISRKKFQLTHAETTVWLHPSGFILKADLAQDPGIHKQEVKQLLLRIAASSFCLSEPCGFADVSYSTSLAAHTNLEDCYGNVPSCMSL